MQHLALWLPILVVVAVARAKKVSATKHITSNSLDATLASRITPKLAMRKPSSTLAWHRTSGSGTGSGT